MKFNITLVPPDQEEEISFSIHKMTQHISEIVKMLSEENEYVETEKNKLPNHFIGKVDETFYKVNVKDIFYFESIDRRIFFYTEKKSYEINEKLYVLEEMLSQADFVRISKSMLLNINKIYSFSPTFSGNLEALLLNKEKVVISRRYVSVLKKQLGMGES
jgi:DNA-binding LytR/AlgR family response regulator